MTASKTGLELCRQNTRDDVLVNASIQYTLCFCNTEKASASESREQWGYYLPSVVTMENTPNKLGSS